MLVGLALREILFSLRALTIIALCISSPLIIAVAYGLIPSGVSVIVERVVKGHVNETILLSSIVEGIEAGAPNATVLLESMRWYIDGANIALFAMVGVLSAFVIARPLEYRYFFLEALFYGSRLKAYLARYLVLHMVAVYTALSASLVAASVLYINGVFTSLADCYVYVAPSLVLTSLSAVSLSALASIYARRVSETILSILGFAALVLLLSSSANMREIGAIVLGSIPIYDNKGFEVYVSSLILTNMLALRGVGRVEY